MGMNRSKLIKRLLILLLMYVQWLVNSKKMFWFWQPCDIWQTKEDVSGTLEAVQNIQSITQALQKSKENYNAKCVEQERLKKEGATQREIEKVALSHLTVIVLLILTCSACISKRNTQKGLNVVRSWLFCNMHDIMNT